MDHKRFTIRLNSAFLCQTIEESDTEHFAITEGVVPVIIQPKGQPQEFEPFTIPSM